MSEVKTEGSIFVFEGVDYTGKSSVAKFCKEFLDTKYPGKIVVYRAPGGNPFSENIRDIARSSEISPETQTALYFACMKEQVEIIKKDISEGKNVILDRWLWSLLCYQIPFIETPTTATAMEHLVRVSLRLENVNMIYFDVEKEDLEKRIAESNKIDESADRFERETQKREAILREYKLSIGSNQTVFSFKSRFIVKTSKYNLEECKTIVLGRVLENFQG